MAYLIHLAVLFAIYGILALSLNLVVGYTGLLSAMHAAFYGVGAYAVAILATSYGVGFLLALLVGMAVSAALALFVGFVLSRFRGDYYALGTIGFTVIAVTVMLNWDSFTRGPLGIPGIPRPSLFGLRIASGEGFLLLALAFLLLAWLAARFLAESSFGRVLRAIREDEEALRVFGYRTFGYKLTVFVLTAAMAAAAGGLYAAYITFVDPSTFTLNESIFVLAVIILGGLGSLRGSLVGAAVLILLPEGLRFVGFPTDIAAQMRQFTYGALLIALMLYRPQGMLGEYKL